MIYDSFIDGVDFIVTPKAPSDGVLVITIRATAIPLGNTVVLEELYTYRNYIGSSYRIQGCRVSYEHLPSQSFAASPLRAIYANKYTRALIKAKYLEYSPGKDLVVHGVHASRAEVNEDCYYTKYLLNAKHPGMIKLPVTVNQNSNHNITASVYPAEMRAALASKLRTYATKGLAKLGFEVIELVP